MMLPGYPAFPKMHWNLSFSKENPFVSFYEDQVISAIAIAVNNLFPARISAGHKTFPQLGFNRLIIRDEFINDSLHFTGRFDKTLHYNVYLSTIIINNNIVIAACPKELFVQLQLDWKKKMELAEVTPLLFGYSWSGGNWPGYVADVRSAALGGYGADQGTRLIEVGAGESIITKQLENYYKLTGLMRDTPGPGRI